MRAIFKPGFKYAKAGVCLLAIETPEQASRSQLDLFAEKEPTSPDSAILKDRSKLMQVMDALNQRYGRATVVPASALHEKERSWAMKQERKTPAYTTDWKQIVQIWR